MASLQGGGVVEVTALVEEGTWGWCFGLLACYWKLCTYIFFRPYLVCHQSRTVQHLQSIVAACSENFLINFLLALLALQHFLCNLVYKIM